MNQNDTQQAIEGGRTVLGVEFGSTRIKAVLIGDDHMPIASGSYEWENRHENGVWTYHLEDVWTGLQESYRKLSDEGMEKYNMPLKTIGAIGFSGMMHGYVALDARGELLVPFRTWRNNITAQACSELTPLLDFAVPQRWSVAHLYQSILEAQPHVPKIARLTTLAGYVHRELTGEHDMGVGEASGMFPIDPSAGDWDGARMAKFDDLIAPRKLGWKLRDILPRVLSAGRPAGKPATRPPAHRVPHPRRCGHRCCWETTSREAPRGSEGPEVDHRSGGRLGGPAAGGT